MPRSAGITPEVFWRLGPDTEEVLARAELAGQRPSKFIADDWRMMRTRWFDMLAATRAYRSIPNHYIEPLLQAWPHTINYLDPDALRSALSKHLGYDDDFVKRIKASRDEAVVALGWAISQVAHAYVNQGDDPLNAARRAGVIR